MDLYAEDTAKLSQPNAHGGGIDAVDQDGGLLESAVNITVNAAAIMITVPRVPKRPPASTRSFSPCQTCTIEANIQLVMIAGRFRTSTFA